jgi:hypothetical protein
MNVTILTTIEDHLDDKVWSPSEFLKWSETKVNEIEPEYRDTATITFEYRQEYDICSVGCVTTYKRPETEQETKHRLQQEEIKESIRKRNELKILAELKAKYES